jgi:hypothetical protein
MVLSTDMTFHFDNLQKMKLRSNSQDFDLNNKDKDLVMEHIIHASDISNPIRSFEISSLWADRVMKEFWQQGDMEKKLNLPVS